MLQTPSSQKFGLSNSRFYSWFFCVKCVQSPSYFVRSVQAALVVSSIHVHLLCVDQEPLDVNLFRNARVDAVSSSFLACMLTSVLLFGPCHHNVTSDLGVLSPWEAGFFALGVQLRRVFCVRIRKSLRKDWMLVLLCVLNKCWYVFPFSVMDRCACMTDVNLRQLKVTFFYFSRCT